MKGFFFSLFLLVQFVYAQSPTIEWQKSFGGSNGDLAYDIKQTIDGGYVFIAYTTSDNGDITDFHGGSDIWVVKTSATGVLEWQKALGGSNDEQSQCIQQTNDGGYILVGYTNSTDGDITELHDGFCTWVVKLSPSGDIQWQKIYSINSYNEAHTIRQTTDGGYIFVGTNYDLDEDPNHVGNDVWVLKLSSLGVIEWQKSFGGTLSDSGYNIQQAADGGYVVLGTSNSSDGDLTISHDSDYWVLKLSGVGEIEWQKTLGGPSYDTAIGLCVTSDGGCVVAGRIQASGFDVIVFHGFVDAWVVKLDSMGTLEWQKTFGGSGGDVLFDIKQTVDGGYIAVGAAGSFDGDIQGNHGGPSDYWVVRLSPIGNLIWQKCLGGTYNDGASRVSLTTDGGCIISGGSVSNDGDITNHYSNEDCWIVKLAPETLSTTNFSNKDLRLYPNPATSVLTLQSSNSVIFDKIVVSDLAGKKVLEQYQNTNQINIEKLARGIYLLRAFSSKDNFVAKFIKE